MWRYVTLMADVLGRSICSANFLVTHVNVVIALLDISERVDFIQQRATGNNFLIVISINLICISI